MSAPDPELRLLRRAWILPAAAAALMAGIHALAALTGADTGRFGIEPRVFSQGWAVITAPFVHGDWEHLGANLVPLVVLGTALQVFYPPLALRVALGSWLITGVWVWAMARPGQHIGASGVIYALAFFLFFSGVFRKDVRAMTLSLIVAFLYGSMVWGLLPAQPGVSWESHLFGALAGMLMAFAFRRQGPQRKRYAWEDEPEESPGDEAALWNYRKRVE